MDSNFVYADGKDCIKCREFKRIFTMFDLVLSSTDKVNEPLGFHLFAVVQMG